MLSIPSFTICRKPSLVPRPPPFFVLQFPVSIIRALPFPCIILNANRRTKNGGEAWELGYRKNYKVVISKVVSKVWE